MNDFTLFDKIFKMQQVIIDKTDDKGINMIKPDRISIENYNLALINCPKIVIFVFQ